MDITSDYNGSDVLNANYSWVASHKNLISKVSNVYCYWIHMCSYFSFPQTYSNAVFLFFMQESYHHIPQISQNRLKFTVNATKY